MKSGMNICVLPKKRIRTVGESLMKNSGTQFKGNRYFTSEQPACRECLLQSCKYSRTVEWGS